MVRFTLKDLLRSTTMVAVGLGLLAYAASVAAPGQLGQWKAIPAGLVGLGAGLIGEGIAAPFKKPWLTATIMCIVAWCSMWLIASAPAR